MLPGQRTLRETAPVSLSVHVPPVGQPTPAPRAMQTVTASSHKMNPPPAYSSSAGKTPKPQQALAEKTLKDEALQALAAQSVSAHYNGNLLGHNGGLLLTQEDSVPEVPEATLADRHSAPRPTGFPSVNLPILLTERSLPSAHKSYQERSLPSAHESLQSAPSSLQSGAMSSPRRCRTESPPTRWPGLQCSPRSPTRRNIRFRPTQPGLVSRLSRQNAPLELPEADPSLRSQSDMPIQHIPIPRPPCVRSQPISPDTCHEVLFHSPRLRSAIETALKRQRFHSRGQYHARRPRRTDPKTVLSANGYTNGYANGYSNGYSGSAEPTHTPRSVYARQPPTLCCWGAPMNKVPGVVPACIRPLPFSLFLRAMKKPRGDEGPTPR